MLIYKTVTCSCCLGKQPNSDPAFGQNLFHDDRGKDVSFENLHQGFTHVFESTFESTEGIAEYVAHPAHVEFANLFLPNLDKVIVFDYKPTIVRC